MTSIIKNETSVPTSLFHIQDHPLINKNSNTNSNVKESVRRSNRNQVINNLTNKVYYLFNA